jgi:hypothetical protein
MALRNILQQWENQLGKQALEVLIYAKFFPVVC